MIVCLEGDNPGAKVVPAEGLRPGTELETPGIGWPGDEVGPATGVHTVFLQQGSRGSYSIRHVIGRLGYLAHL